MEQKILVTGAAGLLGSRLVPLLSRSVPECRIIVVARSEDYRATDSQVEIVRGDLRDKELWLSLPETITGVIHLAAFIPWQVEQRHQAGVVSDNLLPMTHLVEYSQRWPNLRQVIYSSSVSVYSPSVDWLNESSPTQPASLYGAAKLSGEALLSSVNARDVRTVSLRFSSLYAGGQYQGTVLPIMVQRARQRQDLLIFGDGTRTQDYLHCEDAAQAILLAYQQAASGVYNIGSGSATTMTELAETISRVFSDGETRIVYQPERADGDLGIKLDVSKARRELNYMPLMGLEEGLRKLKQEMEDVSE